MNPSSAQDTDSQSNLVVGAYARVDTSSLNVRMRATTSVRVHGQLTNGDTVLITNGPEFADGYTWWSIHSTEQRDLGGWVVEQIDNVQTLSIVSIPEEINDSSEISPISGYELQHVLSSEQTGTASAVAISPNNQLFALRQSDGIHMIGPDLVGPMPTIWGNNGAYAFHPNLPLLAVSSGSTLRLVNYSSGEVIGQQSFGSTQRQCELRQGQSAGISAYNLTFSPDGSTLAALTYTECGIRLFDGNTLAPINQIAPANENDTNNRSLAIHPNGAHVVSGGIGFDGRIRIWQVPSLRRAAVQLMSGPYTSPEVVDVQYTPNGLTIIAALQNGKILHIDHPSGIVRRYYEVEHSFGEGVISGDAQFYTIMRCASERPCERWVLDIWDNFTGQRIAVIDDLLGRIVDYDISYDGSTIAVILQPDEDDSSILETYIFSAVPNLCTAENSRYVVFLDGINSESNLSERQVEQNFRYISSALTNARVENFIYFSYLQPELLEEHPFDTPYCELWGPDGCNSNLDLGTRFSTPIYTSDATKWRIDLNVEVLDWLLTEIVDNSGCPSTRVDLIGYSLGGIVATRWGATVSDDSLLRQHVQSIVTISSPLGGIPFGNTDCTNPTCELWNWLAEHYFGRQVLEDLALPDIFNDPDTIVDDLQDVTDNFNLTAIESERDYLVSGELLYLDDVNYDPDRDNLIIGNGASLWTGISRYVANLGGVIALETDPLSRAEAFNVLQYNHQQALCHNLTMRWILRTLAPDNTSILESGVIPESRGEYICDGSFTTIASNVSSQPLNADVIFINGILNTPQSHIDSLRLVQNTYPDETVIGIYNQSTSILEEGVRDLALNDVIQANNDLIQGLSANRFLALGNPAVDSLVYYLTSIDNEITIVAHSQGAAIVSATLNIIQSEYPEVDISRLKIYTFGGFAINYPEGPQYAHCVNTLDRVPQIAGVITRELMDASSWSITEQSYRDNLFTLSGTVSDVVFAEISNVFIENGQILDHSGVQDLFLSEPHRFSNYMDSYWVCGPETPQLNIPSESEFLGLVANQQVLIYRTDGADIWLRSTPSSNDPNFVAVPSATMGVVISSNPDVVDAQTWYEVETIPNGGRGWVESTQLRLLTGRNSNRIQEACSGAGGYFLENGNRITVPYGDGPTNIYSQPNSQPKLGELGEGELATVTGGPECREGRNGYLINWYITTDSGIQGWIAGGYIDSIVPWVVPVVPLETIVTSLNEIEPTSNNSSQIIEQAQYREENGIHVGIYCQVRGFADARFVEGDAYSWECYNSTTSAPIDFQQACQEVYGKEMPYATLSNASNHFGWRCSSTVGYIAPEASEIVSLTETPESQPVETEQSVENRDICSGSLPARLSVGVQARQILTEDPVRVQNEPGGGTTLFFVYPDNHVTVIGGPECQNINNGPATWWQIQGVNDWVGWVAEGVDDNYYFEPTQP